MEFLASGPEALLITGLLILTLLATEGGFRIGRARASRIADGPKAQITALGAATLGLLALLMGFSLAMAVSRFDDRRHLAVAEANAIGTAHLRARLLPAPDGPALGDLLRRYVDVRLEGSQSTTSPEGFRRALRDSEVLHAQLWTRAAKLVQQDPRSIPVGLFVQALNEVIDLHEKRLMAFESHVPSAVLLLLGLVMITAMGLVGYGCGLNGYRHLMATTMLTALIGLVLVVIVDLDRPRGLIRVSQQSLVRLKEQLAAPPRPSPAAADPSPGGRRPE